METLSQFPGQSGVLQVAVKNELWVWFLLSSFSKGNLWFSGHDLSLQWLFSKAGGLAGSFELSFPFYTNRFVFPCLENLGHRKAEPQFMARIL